MEPTFLCRRCGHYFKTKQNLIRHLQRHVLCIASVEDIDPHQLITDLTRKTYKDKVYVCEFCDKQFNYTSNLCNHRKVCKKKTVTKLQVLEAEIEELRKWVKGDPGRNTVINNNIATQNNITNNITQNISIVLNDFGQEDTSYVESNTEFLSSCMKELLTNAIRSVIEKVYFDEEHPENRTILMKNFKMNQVMIYDNGQWKQRHTSEAIPKMLHKGKKILHQHFISVGDQQKAIEDPENNEDAILKFNYLTNIQIPGTNDYKTATAKIKSAISNNKFKE